MNKNETTQKNSKDVFSACQENIDRFFMGIKQSVPQYHQSITNVQQEYLQAYETVMDSSITLQKECVTKTGISANLPDDNVKNNS